MYPSVLGSCLLGALAGVLLMAQQDTEQKKDREQVEIRLQPGLAPRVVEVAPPTAPATCAIPLLPVLPRANTPMPVKRPDDRGHIRIVEPPAPACESWNREQGLQLLVRPKRRP